MSTDTFETTEAIVGIDVPVIPKLEREASLLGSITEQQLVIDCLTKFRAGLETESPGHPAIIALGQTVASREALKQDLEAKRDGTFGIKSPGA